MKATTVRRDALRVWRNRTYRAADGDVHARAAVLGVAQLAGLMLELQGEADATRPVSLRLHEAAEGEEALVGLRMSLRQLSELGEAVGVDGGTELARAQCDSWVGFALHELGLGDANFAALVVETQAADGDRHALARLDLVLRNRTFLVGHAVTVADVAVAAALAGCAAAGPLNLHGLSNVARWYGTIMHHPTLKGVFFDFPAVAEAVMNTATAAAAEAAVAAEAVGQKKASANAKMATPAAAVAAADAAAAGSHVEATDPVRVEEPDNPVHMVLRELNVQHIAYAHRKAMTVDEQAATLSELPGVLTKNFFMRDKKHGLFLVTLRADREIDTKAIGRLLQLKGKVNLRFGDEALLQEKLGVARGCVGPLAIMNDREGDVTFVLDADLANATEVINSHPLRNDRTTSVSAAGILAFARHFDHEPVILDFSGEATPAAAAGAAAAGATSKSPKKGEAKTRQRQQQHQQQQKGEAKGQARVQEGEITSDDIEAGRINTLAVNATREDNFADWYTQVILRSEMIDYSPISGCYILRPWSFAIWEKIQEWFDRRIKEDLGVVNSYFPMFVTRRALEAEKDHVEGFAPEVAWVTKSGESELQEPIAIRPTSETIMYPAMRNWIQSHRDLPLKLNQWCNVVRWEFKYPTPFLRSREFLWQEGHTVHATEEQAEKMMMDILDLYERVYQDLLAVPVIRGKKTEKEKFAGGLRTSTVEAYIGGSGRAIQGATSHNLGQNFSKMFRIDFEDESGNLAMPWQTSWGLTTRSIGVMIMVHGDNQGLVLPPRVAPTQVIVIPIIQKGYTFETYREVVEDVVQQLRDAGVRADSDTRPNHTPGFKYNHWEQKGVPIRIEIGPRDLQNRSVRLAFRDTGDKTDVPVDGVGAHCRDALEEMQNRMFQKALTHRNEHLRHVTEWQNFVPELNQGNLVMTPFCNETVWEERVKERSRDEALQMQGEEGEDERTAVSVAAKTLCIPFVQPEMQEGQACFISGKPATCWVLWGRSY